jgi:profilin
MSWQEYVDTNLVGSGYITKAAILGQKGGVWASSAGLVISPDEQKAIIGGFNNSNIQATGFRIAGVKYFTVKANERSIYGQTNADGAILVKTNQAILIGIYHSPIISAQAIPIVEGLGDYLINLGY